MSAPKNCSDAGSPPSLPQVGTLRPWKLAVAVSWLLDFSIRSYTWAHHSLGGLFALDRRVHDSADRGDGKAATAWVFQVDRRYGVQARADQPAAFLRA
jgi:hypothetical protein